MNDYIEYTFYDESKSLVAIIKENTPKEIIEELKKQYDEVKYKE